MTPDKLLPFPRIFLVSVACLLPLVAAHGQVEKGGIRGVVIDEDFLTPVPGIQVQLDSGQATSTDADGQFSLIGLEPGEINLSISGDGYGGQREKAVIRSGEVLDVTFKLAAEIVGLDEFVVTAEDLDTPSTVLNLELRQDISSFADVMGTEFITKSGASDIGGVLAKTTGTSVVDSKYVVVRGLSDRYNTIYVNGAKIPSSDPDKRTVNIDLFPSSVIDSVTNYKTFTPNMPSESTGGHIDLRTKAVPEKDFYKFSFSLGYNTDTTLNSQSLTYHGAGTGMFGSSKDRAIPDYLKGLNYEVDIPPVPPQGAEAGAEDAKRRDTIARLLNTNTGVTRGDSPLNFSYGGSVGKAFKWGDSPAGVVGAFYYKKDSDHDGEVLKGRSTWDGSREIYTRREYGQETEQSLLSALLLGAGVKPSPHDDISLTFLWNVAAEDEAGFAPYETTAVGDPTDTLIPGGSNDPQANANDYLVRESIAYTERGGKILQLAGEHHLDDGQGALIRWVGAYGQTYQDQPDHRYINYSRVRSGSGFSFGDPPADFSGAPLERIWRRLDDSNWSVTMDAVIPLADRPYDERQSKLRLGGTFDRTGRDYRADNFAYSGLGVTSASPSPSLIDPDNHSIMTPADNLGVEDRTTTGAGGAGSAIPPFLYRNLPDETYVAEQNVLSAYFVTDVPLGEKVDVQFGARLEDFDLKVQGANIGERPGDTVALSFLINNLETGEPIPESEWGKASISDFAVLPVVNARWECAENMNIRASYSQTKAYPSFKELGPVFTRDPGSSDRFVGNVSLQDSDIQNYDVRWEWYPTPGSIVAASGFSKFIQNPIELTTTGDFTYFSNEESASIYGFELEFSQSLGFLAEELKPFSISSNYTFLKSAVDVEDGPAAQREFVNLPVDRRLQGQPDYIFNFGLNYDSDDLGLSAALLLNVVGSSLYLVGGFQGSSVVSDVYQKPYTTLDFNLSKRITENLKLQFKAQNLTNSLLERNYEFGNLYSVSGKGITYTIGMSADW